MAKRLLQILGMKWIETKVVFDFHDKQLAIDLIADIFYELGTTGLVVEDPDIDHPEDWGKDAIQPEHYAVTGYLLHDEQTEKQLEIIENHLAKLEKKNGIICKIVYSDVNESDWAHVWKAHFRPEKITDNIVVKPTWREYSGNHDDIILEIDPGMAFGTGTHPTTGMCIAMIEKYLKKGDFFLDVGTGSGILMVAAAKLGAGRVWGTDNDEVAVDVACKNLIQNRIAKATFNVITGNFMEKVAARFDVAAANITSKSILILLDDIKKVMVKKGTVICSGIIEEDKNKVIEKMENLGFEVIEILTKENWVSIACRLR
ncbi:MAG: 50S ribosomal protein L11 methyltransferase [Thermodesulfobacteriota bacterium]|nr:50S ribosomal protein L11 methyltransferase [Thermodesulfobacteriota bacterium]